MKLAETLKPLGLVCLALPFVAMLGMIVLNHNNVQGHPEYRFEIEGYDPRDLLKGHFLIFRYKWPVGTVNRFDDSSYPRADQVCACISGETLQPQVQFDSCKAQGKPHCAATVEVSGWASGTGLQPPENLRQFYIPEAQAPLLEKMLRSGGRKFEVAIVPRGQGQAQLKVLYIDGTELNEFLLNESHSLSSSHPD